MKKRILIIIVAALAAFTNLNNIQAADNPAPATRSAVRSVPFNGKLAKLDATAKTITVGERTFQITSETRILRENQAATLDDAKPGENVGGAYKPGTDGKLELTVLRLGTKSGGRAKPKEAPAKEETK